MNEDIQEQIEKPVEGEAKTLEQPLQGNTCNAVKAGNVGKAGRAGRGRRVKRPRPSKRGFKFPKLHRPKKESTRTITTRLYKTWATVVHAQHGDKCAVCGRENSKEAPLNAHHIMPRQMFSGLRFDPQNGISLCPKCHKLGKFSAHKGGIWFAEWLHEKYPEKYRHCMGHLNDELDCKDRSKLYAVENDLHSRYGDAIEPLPTYDVVAYDRKGNKVQSVVQAYNNRAAEFIFWNNWPKTEIPLKGIHRTTETKAISPEKVAEMRSDLIRRGLMDEDGNRMNTPQEPKSTDAAAIAIVQETDASHSKPVSEMDAYEFVRYLNGTFGNRSVDETVMGQMGSLFVEFCNAHGIDPGKYALYAGSTDHGFDMPQDLVRAASMPGREHNK